LLPRAAAKLKRPEGDGYVWAAGEYNEIAAVRQQLVTAWNLDKSRIRAASYWKRGAVAHHEAIDA
jgi:NADPH-dependent ferric siderophore reductase